MTSSPQCTCVLFAIRAASQQRLSACIARFAYSYAACLKPKATPERLSAKKAPVQKARLYHTCGGRIPARQKKKEKCIAPFCVRFALQDYYVFASLSLLDHSYYYHRITVTGARSQENEQHSSEQKSMVLFLSFPDRYLTQHLADSRLVSFLSIINNFSARRYSRRQKSTERGFHLIAVYPHSFFFCLEFIKLCRAVVVVHASPS